MLIITKNQEENIDRVLKRYRRKVKRTKQLNLLKKNKYFKKKSAMRREQIAKARYKEAYERSQEV
ncbi:30S ribosomal protein S21 [Winogradskyella tangerina]|uniref:30S ribosomal protein S21 n=1 Tax=Winogradskyella tangerina TaxID=2023240 RepID=UPI000DBE52D1|nr:30S ribosomal protein S21 [Winogradskyella tangerina]